MKRFVISATPLAMVAASDPVVSVLVDGYPETEFDDFDDAWTVAMNAPAATVKLLADIERTQSIAYIPSVGNARHVLDLNNHTITENTVSHLLIVNKEDAKLTITDRSAEGQGCLYKQMSSMDNLYTVVIIQGDMEIAGGKLYCENLIDDAGTEEAWHPAIAISNHRGNTGRLTISGGTIEAVASANAYAVLGYAPIHVSGGTIRATVTKFKNARALSQQADTAIITGGTFEAYALNTGISSCAVTASSWIGETKESAANSVVKISGGTFYTETATNNAYCVRADASAVKINGEIVTAHGSVFISGGDFSTYAPDVSATQVFAAVASAARLFDDATPHHIIADSKADITITGGNFLVDTRDAEGRYVDNGDNIDLLRSWGTLNVSGGTFTIYQHNNAVGLGIYRNKTTISGNPVFHIHCASNARGMVAGPWNHASYCDADASQNIAEIEVSGGTFIAQSDSASGNSIAIWAYGGPSAASESGEAGYAMNAKITVSGGEFTSIHPLSANVRVIRQENTRTGAYGTAVAEVIIRDGQFKSVAQAETGETTAGRNIDSQEELASLTGGYFLSYQELALHASYDCTLTKLTDADPMYAEGYRYKVEPTSARVATVKTGGTEQAFAMMQGALRYARKQTSPATVTLMKDALFYGPHTLAATVNENDITLDLNGNTVSAITATDRFLTLDKADMSFTLTDRSTDQSGIWQMNATIDATAYGLLCSRGELRIAGGMIIIPSAGNKTTIAFATLSEDARLTISNGQITADRGLLSYGGAITVTGGKFNTPATVAGTPSGTITLTGGYYVSDNRLADYCTFPYEVLPTTDADKARVGDIYAYKISDESSERGIRLDIVDYTPTSLTLNMNGFRSDEEPPYGWEVEAFGAIYRSEDCAANKTLTVTLSEPVEPDATVRICVRSQGGTIESARFYQIPYIFESDATLPEGDYSSSVLYVRSGTLTIDREVQASKVIICPEAELDVTDGLLTADTVVLRSLPTRSAVIYGSFTVDKLYFTRIGPDGSESYPATKYHPFSLPLGYGSPVKDVRLSNGTMPAYSTSWVLRRNTGETEVKLTIDDIVESGKEYEIFSSLPYYREYYFPLSPMATGIENMLDGGAKVRKLLIDGEIRILINGQLYDLMGKRVQ